MVRTNQPRASLQIRIITFYSLLLAGILSVTFLIVTLASYRIADEQLGEELFVGQRLFTQLLQQQQQQLLLASTVLTADFGFLEVVTLDDSATALSVLINHSARIDADIMVLFDLDGELRAHTLPNRVAGDFEELKLLFERSINYQAVFEVVRVDSHLYQVVLVPILAPDVVGWVAVGFLVDAKLAQRLKQITGLEVSFLSDDELLVTTLSPDDRLRVATEVTLVRNDMTTQDAREVMGYKSLLSPVSDTGMTVNMALLQQTPLLIMARFTPVQLTLAVLSLIAMIVTVVGSYLIARRITKPINNLAAVADKVREGNYEVQISAGGNDEIGRLAASLQHMVDAVSERQAEIQRLAFEDGLTGLPNRALFNRELEQLARLSHRAGMTFSIIFLELNRFKQINETLGYDAGDKVLRYVANQLPDCVRDSDTVASLGGDEFGILLPMNTPDQIQRVTDRIAVTFREPYVIGEQPVDIVYSIGIAHYPDHAQDAQTLLRRADVALQKAKRARTGIAIYDNEQEESRREYLNLLGELRQAVEQNQLCLHYQPKLHLQSGQVTAAEALIRWEHPVRGMVSPGLFIPFAEHTGAIRMVTEWVIEHTLQQLSLWRDEEINLQVSLNISTRDLLNPELPKILQRSISEYDIDPKIVCLEITESALMEDPVTALNTVTRLAGLKVDLAIDDYGTGYSSLAYIKNLPVNELKIDREFIMNMGVKAEDLAIVQSTIELGHNLGLKVVAEGVETAEEMAQLRALGCDFVQGYYVAKPMPAAGFTAWMKQR